MLPITPQELTVSMCFLSGTCWMLKVRNQNFIQVKAPPAGSFRRCSASLFKTVEEEDVLPLVPKRQKTVLSIW